MHLVLHCIKHSTLNVFRLKLNALNHVFLDQLVIELLQSMLGGDKSAY